MLAFLLEGAVGQDQKSRSRRAERGPEGVPPVSSPPKDVLGQRYRLTSLIGKGGMGTVWRGEHTSLRTQVAVKILDPKLAHDPSLRARFLREAQSAAALQSQHIVRILDHGVDDDIPYIAMELLAGESLRKRLARERILAPKAAAKVLAGTVKGIARAHKAGIIHRDLKPDNIFIAQDEELGEVVKVVDFGIAKVLADSAARTEADDDSTQSTPRAGESISTVTGALLGTPYYMSPEQLRGRKEVDLRSDLWSLGVIAFECLTGKRPYAGQSFADLIVAICANPTPVPSRIAPVPKGFDEWFAKACTVDVNQRFQTIKELVQSLESVLTPDEHWLPADSTESVSSSPTNELETAPTLPADDNSPDQGTHAAHTVPTQVSATRRWVGSRPALVGMIGALLIVGTFAVYVFGQYDNTGQTSNLGSATVSASSSTNERAVVSASSTAPSTAAPSTTAPSTTLSTPSAVSNSASAPASLPNLVTSVAITFETKPVGVEIVHDKKPLGLSPGPHTFEKSSTPITLHFKKNGYQTEKREVVPDDEKTIKVDLRLAPRPSDVLH